MTNGLPDTVRKRRQRLRFLLTRALEVCVFAAFAVFTLTTVIAVFNRFALNRSFVEAEELIRFALVWMTMLAAPLVTGESGHLSGSFMGFMQSPVAVAVERAAVRGGIALFGILLAWSSVELIDRTISHSPALGMHMGFAYGAMLIGGVLEFVMAVLDIVDPVQANRGGAAFE